MSLEGSTMDLVVHIATFAVSVAVFGVSINAYRKEQSRKFMLVGAAFGLFALKELMLILNIVYFAVPALTASAHVLNLFIIGMFFYGVVR